jgi:hypothetical protein
VKCKSDEHDGAAMSQSCNQLSGGRGAARRLVFRRAAEVKRPPRLVQRQDDLAVHVLDGRHLSPWHVEIAGTPELEP